MIKNVNRKTKKDPRYEGPFYIHGYSTNNSYILRNDREGPSEESLISRDVPTHHLKIIRDDDSVINESNDEEAVLYRIHSLTSMLSIIA